MGELGDPMQTINLLLLGETGTGKSTFVNSFVNYMRHNTLEESEKSKLVCTIPSSFTIMDEDYDEHEVSITSEEEFYNIEGPREFTFEFEDFSKTICLVDTPGVGTAQGLENDELSICKIIDYMQRFEHINAFCFFLKPNITILTDYFRFCITHLLSCVDGMAAPNIVFIFTHTRSSSFRPGDTYWVLKQLLEEFEKKTPHITVPVNKSNVFCFDNEGFRYRVASENGFKFDEQEKECFARSWEVSADNCRRLVKYIAGDGQTPGLRPYKIVPKTFAPEAQLLTEEQGEDFSKAAVKLDQESQKEMTDFQQSNNEQKEHVILELPEASNEVKKLNILQSLILKTSVGLGEENLIRRWDDHSVVISDANDNSQHVKVPAICDRKEVHTDMGEANSTNNIVLHKTDGGEPLGKSYQECIDQDVTTMQNNLDGQAHSTKKIKIKTDVNINSFETDDISLYNQEGTLRKIIPRFLKKCSLM